MSIEDLKNKNELADLHSDWEDLKTKFETSRLRLENASIILQAHGDYAGQSTSNERTDVDDYDAKLLKMDS